MTFVRFRVCMNYAMRWESVVHIREIYLIKRALNVIFLSFEKNMKYAQMAKRWLDESAAWKPMLHRRKGIGNKFTAPTTKAIWLMMMCARADYGYAMSVLLFKVLYDEAKCCC